MKEKILDLQDQFSLIRRSVGFIANHTEDDEAMAALILIDKQMEDFENKLRALSVLP